MKSMSPLSEVRGIHKGCRAFVLGGGYSVNDFDFDELGKSDIIFSTNQSITVMKHCNYFCMTDCSIPEANIFEYGIGVADKVAFCNDTDSYELPGVLDHWDQLKDKCYFFERRWGNRNNLDFGLDDGLMIVGTDVIHVVSHLAHVMGCSPIVLVGVDLGYRNGQKYCVGTEFTEKIVWWINRERYPKKWKDIQPPPLAKDPSGKDDQGLRQSLGIWRSIKEANKNIVFLNANPKGGLSELFETYEQKRP